MNGGRIARAGYATLLRGLTPVYLARLWWRGRRERAYRHAIPERLGVYADPKPQPGALWLHAVSLGETRAAAPLIDALRAHRPGLRLLLTHSTATGREAGVPLLQPGDVQAWLPYDTPGAVRRFLRHFRPALGVLMETEVWPVLLIGAQQAGVPMVLANARLSMKSLRKGLRLKRLLQPAVNSLAAVLAQTESDAQRLRAVGAPSVQVCGNLKFDMTPPPELLAQGQGWRAVAARPVVLGASTREGEEAALLAAWRALPSPRPLLLVVPRHPQRFDEVAQLVQQAGFTLARRSSWSASPTAEALQANVWLGDSMGEMPLYAAMADVALLGGSFEPLGGQNLIEAAACGCPVVMGPHTFNFAEAAELALAAGAAERVNDLPQGVRRAAALAGDAAQATWAQRALAFAQAHRGATERMASRVLELLPMH
ncbi:lipid IV(A) 3-deoxy-D-manno-octulosonic acid transferase [Ideonella sp. BN130291]|uniref:lipid IV(A) 3-deoxy-D-manno-octulosonic acid transferase n=1 Tax=Ideonella sp. BN130291 TaxID=3112940 RepID=UPI002E252CAF|nr:lipid IV(A) 3-deoxy-D-manno-octulosonic acid transferase [Ideonella sp. BN130291]